MGKKLSVAFLWHMHQPLYKDFVSGKYYLPWVRLHSTYSYLDMASILEGFPHIKCTFNFSPSLIWQLLDIAKGGDSNDLYLELSAKRAEELTEEDKLFILKNFFSCHHPTAIAPVRKYNDLFHRRGNDLADEKIKARIKDFSIADFRDLQVFFNLAWCGFTLREKDPLIKELVKKEENYSDQDKEALLKKQKEVVASILPLYKKLQDEGQIEVSTTPYYHPIMPLLCSKNENEGFRFCKDAKWHVQKAVELYKEVFGRKPLGMWPSEGGVSRDVVPIFTSCGIKWIATDESILYKSFPKTRLTRDQLLFNLYKTCCGFHSINMVFRDVNMSNAISFRYSNMPVEQSSRYLFHDILGVKKAVEKIKGEHIVSIILDGENPWPYYRNGGKDFLSAIYKLLSLTDEVETVTVGGYVKKHRPNGRIKKLASGSWIYGNFKKWIGSPQKNMAWEYLKRTREDLFSVKNPDKRALEELYIAEGSDWFWWYDEFGTELNFIFDELFRLHLANIYSMIGKKAPAYIKESICGKNIGSASGSAMAGN